MKNDNLKRIITYIFTSTGAVLFFLTAFVLFKENKYINASTILEILAANTVISTGLFFTHKIEFRYAILEFALDIGFMMAVIVLSGILFCWFSVIPAWIPLIIVLMVYILFYLLDIIRVHRDIKEINKLLQKLKEKEAKTAS
jgi:hypothetical protein